MKLTGIGVAADAHGRCAADDLELARQWQSAMWGKAAGHGVGTADYATASRSMSAIGG